jgi:hypothetical protein
MENDKMGDKRIQARDAATRTLNRLTAGLAFGAVAGVGLLGAVSAYTIPGTTTTSSGAIASSSTSTGTSSTGLQASPTPVSSSSGSGIAVSGGS